MTQFIGNALWDDNAVEQTRQKFVLAELDEIVER